MATRTGFYLRDDDVERLARLARRRFGESQSAAIRYALEIADVVLHDPETFYADSPAEALDAYARAHVAQDRTADDVAERLDSLADGS